MLTQAEATTYLLQHALVTPDAVVDGNLTLTDVSRRNHDLRIVSDTGPCYFLKQGSGRNGSNAVAHEAAVYGHLLASPEAGEFRGFLPRCVAYDENECLLVLELVPNSEDLLTYHARRGVFPTSLAATMGHALSTLHRSGAEVLKRDASGVFSGRRPWVLFLDQPGLAIFRDISGANLQVIRILQSSPEFRSQLEQLRVGWRADTLIHHDMKWDNVLVAAASASGRRSRIKIIDWEFADGGDPCWDAGAMFGNYLSFWLTSVPITGEELAERALELARHPLHRMQPAMRAYWQSYVQGMRLDVSTSREWLLRAVRYAAARLIQTGYEQMQASAQLTGNLVCLLQLSLNILQRPHEAAVHLLGIPLVARPAS